MENKDNLPKSIEEFDQLIQVKKEEKKQSAVGYILLSLLFPPFTLFFALLLAWRKGVLDIILPSLVIVFSIFSLLIAFSQFYTVKIPQMLEGLGIDFGTVVYSQNVKLLSYLFMLLIVISLIVSIYYRLSVIKVGKLTGFAIWLLLGLMTLQIIAGIYIFIILSKSLFESVSPTFDTFEGL